ncbi:MAG: protein-glutamate O-methyltransferase CheR [Gammaproteobacteria bacterium]|nr:MAG: protein-glutamate O-methyltransferase CheR [Gammaproteobacteria bacterium]
MSGSILKEENVQSKRDYLFSDDDFNFLRKLVTENTGIVLADHKRDMVYGRLCRRLRALNLDSFSDYCELVRSDNDGELVELVNAITTNLTSFFREPHHFDYLSKTVLPELVKHKARTKQIRIWSAGCSTGEEPYSIAMVVQESLPEAASWNIKILATDLDSNCVETARKGVYKEERVSGISGGRLRRWFKRGVGPNAGLARVKPELQRLIDFKPLNLLHTWPMRGPFDLIFCRNVVIYFDKQTQARLFSRYADILDDRGHLYIGHSESLYKVTDRFELIGQTIYRKAK